jgi:hypothetical protein
LSSTHPANHHRVQAAGGGAGQPLNRVFERHTLAGMVLVAINPVRRSVALDFVLRQSGGSGIFLNPTYRGFNMTSGNGSIVGLK